MKRAILAGMISMVAVLPLAACAHNYNLECDAGDYVQHDSDCGYVNTANQWIYFDWTKPNVTTHSPDNWEPPAGVEIEQDSDTHKKKKKVSATKPAPKSSPTRRK
jgi:hypothetical protein